MNSKKKAIDKRLQAIVAEAARAKTATPNAFTPKNTPQKIIQSPENSERYAVYRALFPIYTSSIVWIGLIFLWFFTIGLALFVPPLHVWQRYFPWQLGVTVLFTAWSFYPYFMRWSHFYNFQQWRARLFHMRIVGWHALVDTPYFTDEHFWQRHCAIQLHFFSGYDMNNEEMEAILYNFCRNANLCLYPTEQSDTGFHQDPRLRWRFRENQLSGSVNCHVARQILILCQNLSLKNHKEDAVESVLITTSSCDEYFVPHYIAQH